MRWTDGAVREALGLGAGDRTIPYADVSTDTRRIGPGSLFVALAGDRFDGHAFLGTARDAGATGAVVRAGTSAVPGLTLYPVDDALHAYGCLARHRRRALAGPVVAITGTNGKTSTKEMMAAALATRYRVHATRANLNNLVGVPQTILEAADDVEALVVEAGANLPGEIARYREIIEPSLVIVTNVAAGHLEGFGSLEGVLAEKLALVREVPVAVVSVDEPALAAGARRLARRVVTAGVHGADVVPDRATLEASGRATIAVDGVKFTVAQIGLHQARNAMLVWAAARELGLDPVAVARALESFTIPAGRGEVTEYGPLTILNDCYNANPASFLALIDVVRSIRGSRRLVFVAGTMRELGGDAARLHGEVARALVDLAPDLLAGVGEFGSALEPWRVQLGDRLVVADDGPAMGRLLAPRLRGDELVVLKGSRGMALERMIPDLVGWTEP